MNQRFILIGPPACGKGTQGRRLAKALGLEYLSTGALLREHMVRESEIGNLAKPILDRGGYLPDALMCGIIEEWLDSASEGWVLDGFPRSVPQAEFLEGILGRMGRPLTAAIAFEAPFEVLKTRIWQRVECPDCRWSGGAQEAHANACPECGAVVEVRADDDLDNFTSRYEAYCQSALPLVDAYRQKKLLCSCDATRSRDEVTAELMQHFAPATNGGLPSLSSSINDSSQ